MENFWQIETSLHRTHTYTEHTQLLGIKSTLECTQQSKHFTSQIHFDALNWLENMFFFNMPSGCPLHFLQNGKWKFHCITWAFQSYCTESGPSHSTHTNYNKRSRTKNQKQNVKPQKTVKLFTITVTCSCRYLKHKSFMQFLQIAAS